ncbi:hypothetical protein Rhe02_97470 [Rhizocola hellebori]|uniref:DUF4190 domain-containing protein n=1 Tax=Rhizocola hellebori TaxID=1392758 RepID=A0A8J3VM77_9ACTN|nr:DUF4190 domain-containing protein [Rhizocola hellebori]GIH11680.1 hypothetical protein Rhe02_97470 [Rhizocola hellebori]
MTYPPPGGQDPYQPQPSGPEGSNPYSPPPTGPVGGSPYSPPPAGPDSGNPYAQATPPSAYPQPYGQPYGQYPAVPAATGTNGLSLASMITGIVSVILGCCCPFLGIPAAGTAMVLGFLGLKQTRERGQSGRGMAIAGIATGGVGLLIGIVMAILGATDAMTGWMDDLNGSNTDDFDFD